MTTKKAWLYLASLYQDYADVKINNKHDRIFTKEESLTFNGLCSSCHTLRSFDEITFEQTEEMIERINTELAERKLSTYLANYNRNGALVRVECCKKFAAELTD